MNLYNPIKNTLSNGEKTIKIGYRESQILTLLLERSPEVVKKQDIVQFAWGNEYIGETSLAKSISVLRQSFIKIGIKDSPILTVPKVGYRLVEDVLLNECLVTINAPKEERVPAKPEEISQPAYAIKQKPGYRNLVCYVVSLSFLFAAVLMVASKYHSSYSHPQFSRLLNEHTVGSLEVYMSPSTSLSLRVQELLAENQCQCVVYIEENNGFSGLSWLNKKTRKSINVFYTPDQFEQASKTIAQFVAEERR
ncbi:transcriptional regulator [Vibrio campbellii]|uniref:transcriptional regulator n=1 Tax=Vibrio campbellii TaxID=680 RepID=UPI0002ADE498|nr:winged helix-turn-helix domain-containing protein [Vibrio campbellii]ARV72771.1 transcriptional regulator [Vibrio campbellii CAIM 519 = NBRC 15631 = ATCC 25920]ELU50341.1 hypothetical protein B878_18575 [Vibrio campbellii CAIM 519 = NBRC 15631 = ATCC 25920]